MTYVNILRAISTTWLTRIENTIFAYCVRLRSFTLSRPDDNRVSIETKKWLTAISSISMAETAEVSEISRVSLDGNANTKRSTLGHMNLLKAWLRENCNELQEPESIEPKKFDILLAQFYAGVRKPGLVEDADDVARQYEPQTLVSIHNSIARFLREKEYPCNIKLDKQFRHAREVLASMQKKLRQLGKGNKPNSSLEFTPNEIHCLAEKQLLGTGKLA